MKNKKTVKPAAALAAPARKGPRPEAVQAIIARCAEWMLEQEEAAAQAGRSAKQKPRDSVKEAQVPA